MSTCVARTFAYCYSHYFASGTEPAFHVLETYFYLAWHSLHPSRLFHSSSLADSYAFYHRVLLSGLWTLYCFRHTIDNVKPLLVPKDVKEIVTFSNKVSTRLYCIVTIIFLNILTYNSWIKSIHVYMKPWAYTIKRQTTKQKKKGDL